MSTFCEEKKSLSPTSILASLENIGGMAAILLVGAEEGNRLTENVGFRPNLVLKGNKGAQRLGRQGHRGWKTPLLSAALRGWARAVCTKEAGVRLGFIRFNLYQTENT